LINNETNGEDEVEETDEEDGVTNHETGGKMRLKRVMKRRKKKR